MNDLSEDDVTGKQKMKVEQIIMHEDWSSLGMRFTGDIAILKLIGKVTFTNFVQPICLMTDNEIMTNISKGKVAGWGTNGDHGASVDVARIADLDIIEKSLCFQKDSNLARISWNDAFCAGSESQGVCQGDSGSGLYVEIDNKFYLKGIVSSSIVRKCSEKSYALFSDVAKYYDFIETSVAIMDFKNVLRDVLNQLSPTE